MRNKRGRKKKEEGREGKVMNWSEQGEDFGLLEVLDVDLDGMLTKEESVKVCVLNWRKHLEVNKAKKLSRGKKKTCEEMQDDDGDGDGEEEEEGDDDDVVDSTGLRPFGAAYCLCWMTRSLLKEELVQERVKACVELGCGHGLCGLLACKVLPREVPCILTDGSERALSLADKSIEANQFCGSNCYTRRVWWGDRGDMAAVLDQINRGEEESSDGGNLILAADLIYMGKPVPLLVQTIRTLMGSGGACLMSFSPRELNWQDKIYDALKEENLEAFVLKEEAIPSSLRNYAVNTINMIFGPQKASNRHADQKGEQTGASVGGLELEEEEEDKECEDDDGTLLGALVSQLKSNAMKLEDWKRQDEKQNSEFEEEWFLRTADDCFS